MRQRAHLQCTFRVTQLGIQSVTAAYVSLIIHLHTLHKSAGASLEEYQEGE